jgi:CHAD domain-containing protein
LNFSQTLVDEPGYRSYFSRFVRIVATSRLRRALRLTHGSSMPHSLRAPPMTGNALDTGGGDADHNAVDANVGGDASTGAAPGPDASGSDAERGPEAANSDRHDAPGASTDAATATEGRPARPCSADDSILQLVYCNLDRQYAAFEQQVRRARAEGITVAGVHGMRTASRRMRATLKIFRDLLPRGPRRHFAAELAWFAGELGRVRDLDVQCATIEHDIAAAAAASARFGPYLARLRQDRDAAAQVLASALRSVRVHTLLSDFAAFLDAEPSAAARRRWADLSARDGATEFGLRARRRLRKLERRANDDPAPERMHALRIRCKRFRYLLECFEPICDDRLREHVQVVRKLQDTLGEYQDAHVAIERISADLAALGDSEQDGTAKAPLLELSQAREQDAAAARKRFRKEWLAFERCVTKKKLLKLCH